VTTVRPDAAPPPGAGLPVLDLHYRSAGSFLIAYSSRLSRGEIFIETEKPWPPGSRAALRLHAPGAPVLDLAATVSWIRAEALGPGQPAGMGLELSPPIEAYGPAIDALASRYARVRILLGTDEPAPRAIMSRYLRSILACELVDVDFRQQPAVFDGAVDLAVVDLDSSGAAGGALIEALRKSVATADLPVVALAQMERDRARGVALGADEALTNPPLYPELQSAVIHGLSRPRISVAT
jgi:CheY-like chemotaxis protein/Tfp pilus assembly protein PilZ